MQLDSEEKALVTEIQEILIRGETVGKAVTILASVMINLGCHLAGIKKELNTEVIRSVQQRYYSPGQQNMADALILQGLAMLSWEEGPDGSLDRTKGRRKKRSG